MTSGLLECAGGGGGLGTEAAAAAAADSPRAETSQRSAAVRASPSDTWREVRGEGKRERDKPALPEGLPPGCATDVEHQAQRRRTRRGSGSPSSVGP